MKPFKFQEGGTSPNSLIFGTDENPIELQGVDITAKKLNWLEKRWNDIKWAFRDVANDINRQADLYVANHRRAEERNPNFNRDWDMHNNINEFVNAATGGFWKNSSPSQLVGTVAHIVRGEPVLDSWMNFNNGVVGVINEDWANEHPYLTMAGNMIFDGVALNAKSIARGTVNTAKNVYNNGTLWDKYTTLGGRFGYYGNPLQRVWGTVSRNLGIPSAPKHPELLRKLDGVPYLTENGLLNFNTTRTGLLGEGHSNWTFDRPVVSHSKGNWDGKDLYIIDPEEFQKVVSKENVKSIEPSDVFVQDANAFINPKRVTLVSGNPESLIQARKMGMSTLSSPRLRGLYKPETKIGRFSLDKGNYGNLPYALEQQRLQQRRGVPTLSDFRFIEDQYGLKAGVIPISEYLQNSLSDAVENMLQNPTQTGTWTYPNGREVQLIPGGTYINKALYQRNLVEKAPYNNVFYDPASPIEINSGVTNRKK